MREIKFRAWDRKEGVMLKTPVETTFDEAFLEYPTSHWPMSWNTTQRDIAKGRFSELMQYTGLKDKNGVEIYEGDIVIAGEPNEDGSWNYSANSDSPTIVKWTNSYKPGFDFPQMCEVVGNVHENSDHANASLNEN